jgi:hypothetical protein
LQGAIIILLPSLPGVMARPGAEMIADVMKILIMAIVVLGRGVMVVVVMVG